MDIRLITPAPRSARNGNRITAERISAILRKLGHRVVTEQVYDGATCDLMIALHARRSFESIRRFKKNHPDRPLIVVLTGTDLYRDIHARANAQKSLEWADRLILLQSMGLKELPRRYRAKACVIYQSTENLDGYAKPSRNNFKISVIGHLRREKDPMRTALAARRLPASSKARIVHIGAALSGEFNKSVQREARRNSRYRWLGALPHWRTKRELASSHLLCLTSRMEGSSNALCEALAASVPVIASKIPGLMGTLGKDYPGYFPVGDTRALARLLHRAESEPAFYRRLKSHCARLKPLVDPRREVASWRRLLGKLS